MASALVRVRRHCGLPAERVLAAAYDFGPDRERVWPNVSLARMEVHALHATSSDVTEGTWIVGVWWERCRYDWSQPRTVTATVVDSNVYVAGVSSFVLTATPAPAGGCTVDMVLSRRFRNTPKGLAAAVLYKAGRHWLFGSMLDSVLREVAASRGQQPSGPQASPVATDAMP